MNRVRIFILAGAFACSTAAMAGPSPIVAWCDSLTAGAKASSPAMSYPAQLGTLLGSTVRNAGVGGQTSREIAARQGGSAALLTFAFNQIPRANPATTTHVSVFPITAQGPGKIWGRVKDIHGYITRVQAGNGSWQLQFQRDAGFANLPEVVAKGTPFQPDSDTRDWTNVLWMGRNNFSQAAQVIADARNCIGTLTSDRYLVISVLNGAGEGHGTAAHQAIVALNDSLAQNFPGRYLDVRRALINAYDPTRSQDVADYTSDTVPASLRGDNVHLNDKGYAIVASEVARFITSRGW